MNSDKELTDIVEEILQDHRELEDYYAKYKAAPSTEESQKWFNQFLWEICRHAVAEEIILYPMLESKDERGIQLATVSREDHRKLKVELEDLRKESDQAKFDQKFDALFKDLMDHIKMEESQDLLYIKEQFSLEERKKAAKSFDLRKKIAPTRPHPWVPDKPTALEEGLGLLAAPLDKLRDMFKSFPEEVKKGSTKFNKDTLKYVFQENPDMAIWIYNFMLKTSDSGNVDYEAFENALEVLIKDTKTFQLNEFRNYSTLDMLALLMLGDFTLKKEDLRQITISYIQAFDYMRNLLKVFQYKATVARQIDEFALKVVVDGCFNHALAQDGHDRIDWASFLRYIKDNLPFANRCLKAFFTAKFLPNQTDISLPDLSKPSQLLNRDFIGLLYLSNVYMSDINRLQLLYSSSFNGLSFDRLAQALRNYNGSTYILLKVVPQQTGQREDNFSIIGAFNRPSWRSDNVYNGDSDCHVFSLVPNYKSYFVYDKADDAHANYAYLKVGSGIGSGIGFGGTGNNDFRLWIDGTDFNKSYARSEDHVYGPGPLINGSDGYIKILNIEVWGLSSDANPPSLNTSVVTAGSSGIVYSQPQIPSQTNNPNYYLDHALSQFENRLSKVEQERQSRSGLISLQSNPSNPGSTQIVENVQQESVKKSYAPNSREFDDLGYGSTVSQKEMQKRAVNNGDTYVSERKTFTSTRNVNVDWGAENMDRGRATYTETGNYYNPFKGEYKQNDPKLSRDQNGRTYINDFH